MSEQQKTAQRTTQKTAHSVVTRTRSVARSTGKWFWAHKHVTAACVCFIAGLAGVKIGFVSANKLIR